ncbi:MAG: NAD(P)-binding domain-containing protein [Bacteroidota bacterium]
MKCVVVGTGWLGSPLAGSLAQKGHSVTGTRRSVTILAKLAYHLMPYPPASRLVKDVMKEADVVILAFPPNRSSTDQYTNDCLAVCELISPDCNVILTSSTSVYEVKSGTCVEEDLVYNPESTNRIHRAEHALWTLLGDRLTIVRLAGLIGPNRHPVRNMIKSGITYAANQPINVIHQQDAIGLIEHVIEKQLWGETINGCSPEHPARGAYYTWMATKLELTPPLFEDASGESKLVSSEKSLKLGYNYQFPNPFDFPLN